MSIIKEQILWLVKHVTVQPGLCGSYPAPVLRRITAQSRVLWQLLSPGSVTGSYPVLSPVADICPLPSPGPVTSSCQLLRSGG